MVPEDDRCTCFPNGDWIDCCRFHDYGCADAYCQLSMAMRLKADKDLKKCVGNKGVTFIDRMFHTVVSYIIWIGVSLYRIVVCKWIRGYK